MYLLVVHYNFKYKFVTLFPELDVWQGSECASEIPHTDSERLLFLIILPRDTNNVEYNYTNFICQGTVAKFHF